MKKHVVLLVIASSLILASCNLARRPIKSSQISESEDSSSEISSSESYESSETSEESASSSKSTSKTSSSSSSISSSSSSSDEVVVSSTLQSKFLSPKFNESTGEIETSSYDSQDIQTTYFRGYDSIPYVVASDALSFAHTFRNGASLVDDEGVLTVSNSSYTPDEVIIDASNDTIWFADYEHFAADSGSGNQIATDSVGGVDYYSYLQLSSSELLDDDRSLTFYLGDYGADILCYQNETYVPAMHLFGTLLGSNLAIGFNGQDYYLAYDAALENDSYAYTQEVYSGPYVSKRTRDSSFAQYNYDYLCFMLDHFYGLADDSELKPFDVTLENEGYKSKLLSTNVSTYNNALFDFVETVLDEGHSHTDYKSYYNASYAVSGRSSQSGVRNSEIINAYYDVYSARGRNTAGYFTYGDVAVLRFDAFQDNFYGKQYVSYVDDPTQDDFDVFSFFYSSFEKIQANSSINNVVIDLSMNGGGEVGSLFGAIGFLGGSFSTSITNPLTGSIMHETYKVDTNLDGKFNSSDGFKGQYNFYILTSGYSYSCASFMPELCKENGIATPIGHKSGGGACSVGYFASIDGAMGWMSSNMLASYKQSDGSYINYEHGYPVESKYQFDYSNYFTLSKLAAKVDSF